MMAGTWESPQGNPMHFWQATWIYEWALHACCGHLWQPLLPPTAYYDRSPAWRVVVLSIALWHFPTTRIITSRYFRNGAYFYINTPGKVIYFSSGEEYGNRRISFRGFFSPPPPLPSPLPSQPCLLSSADRVGCYLKVCKNDAQAWLIYISNL